MQTSPPGSDDQSGLSTALSGRNHLFQILDSDYRFLQLFDDAPDALVQVDAQGVIVIANRTAEQMFGYSRAELLGSSVDMLIPEGNRAAHPDHRNVFIESGVARRSMGNGPGDLLARRKDGTVFSADIALSRVSSETGIYVTAAIRDVTDRRRIERELEGHRAERGQRIEILARLAAGLAHEIRNPLAIIHARASDLAATVSKGDVDPAQIERTCVSIINTSNRAIRILRGISMLARDGDHGPFQQASMGEIVEQSVEMVSGRYKASGIHLTVDLPLNLPTVECHEIEISQILVNLLNNAFDAIDGDSRSERWVRVQASVQHAAENDDQIDRMRVEVLDGGPGVAAKDKDRLMQPFFTTKEVGSGIGIGLSISREIAERHGGELELRECDGHTCFRLTLPLQHMEGSGDVTA